MALLKVFVAILLAAITIVNASIVAPVVQHVAYSRAIPYNVLPFANSVNVYTRTLASPLLSAYSGIHPSILRTSVYPALAPAAAPVAKITSFLPAPFVAPAPPLPVASAIAPAVAPAVAPAFAPAVIPAVAPNIVSAPTYPAVTPAVAPVVRTINPYYPTLVPSPINPAYGRSIHEIAPAAEVAPTVPVAYGVSGIPAPAYPAIAPAVAPVARTIDPYYPTLVPSPINPAYGRSIHAVAPAAQVAPGVPVASAVPVSPGVPASSAVPVPAHYVGK